MDITLAKRERRPSSNAIAGLDYRMIAVRKQVYEKLRELKEQTSVPMTELVAQAIDYYLANVQVR